MATEQTDRERAVAKWDQQFIVWFSPVVTNMPVPDAFREKIRQLASERRNTIRYLRRTERAFLAILAAPELFECLPHAFDLAHSYRYVRSLRDVIRGLLAVGEFDRAFTLLDRIVSMLLEDSFTLATLVPKTALCRKEVDTFSHNVRIFESSFSDLKRSKLAVCANV